MFRKAPGTWHILCQPWLSSQTRSERQESFPTRLCLFAYEPTWHAPEETEDMFPLLGSSADQACGVGEWAHFGPAF